jgi:hypothetical protein
VLSNKLAAAKPNNNFFIASSPGASPQKNRRTKVAFQGIF